MLKVTRRQIVDEARTWFDTPYLHQAHLKGVGADCHGLLRGVGLALGLLNMAMRDLPEVRPFQKYGREPNGNFLDACRALFDEIPIESARAGDIVAIRFQGHPRHCGILADHPSGGLSLIHIYQRMTVHEHRIDAKWRRRIVAAFQYRGLSDE